MLPASADKAHAATRLISAQSIQEEAIKRAVLGIVNQDTLEAAAAQEVFYNTLSIDDLPLDITIESFFNIFASILNKKSTLGSSYQGLGQTVKGKAENKLITDVISYHIAILNKLQDHCENVSYLLKTLSSIAEFQSYFSSYPISVKHGLLIGRIESLKPLGSTACLVDSANCAIGIKCIKKDTDVFDLVIFDPSYSAFKIKGAFPVKGSHIHVYENLNLKVITDHLWCFFMTPAPGQSRAIILNTYFYPFIERYRAATIPTCASIYSSSPSRTSVCDVIRLISIHELGLPVHRATYTLIKAASLRLASTIRADSFSLSQLRLLEEAAQQLILRCAKRFYTMGSLLYKTGLSAGIQTDIIRFSNVFLNQIKLQIENPMAPSSHTSDFTPLDLSQQPELLPYRPNPIQHQPIPATLRQPLFDLPESRFIETADDLERTTTETIKKLSALKEMGRYYEPCITYPNSIAVPEFYLLMNSTGDPRHWPQRLLDADQTLKIIRNLYLILDKLKMIQSADKHAICSPHFVNASLKCLLLIAICCQRYEDTVSLPFKISPYMNPFGTLGNPSELEKLLSEPHLLYLDSKEIDEFNAIKAVFQEIFPQKPGQSIMDTLIMLSFNMAEMGGGNTRLARQITYPINRGQDALSDLLLEIDPTNPAEALSTILSNKHDINGPLNHAHYCLRSMFYTFSNFLTIGDSSYKLTCFNEARLIFLDTPFESLRNPENSTIFISCNPVSSNSIDICWLPAQPTFPQQDTINGPFYLRSIGSYETFSLHFPYPQGLYTQFYDLTSLRRTVFINRLDRLALLHIHARPQNDAADKQLTQIQLAYRASFTSKAPSKECVIYGFCISAINRSIIIPTLAIPSLLSGLKQRPEMIQTWFNCLRIESQLFKTYLHTTGDVDPICLRSFLSSQEGKYLAIETLRALIAYYDFTSGKIRVQNFALSFIMRLHAIVRSYLEAMGQLPEDFPHLPYETYLNINTQEIIQETYWHRAFYAINRQEIKGEDVQKVIEAILYETRLPKVSGQAIIYSHIKEYVLYRLNMLKAFQPDLFSAQILVQALIETRFISKESMTEVMSIIDPNRFNLLALVNGGQLYELNLFNQTLSINGAVASYSFDSKQVYEDDVYKSLFGYTQHPLTPRDDGIVFWVFSKEFRFVQKEHHPSCIEVKMEGEWWQMLSQPKRNHREGLSQLRRPSCSSALNTSFSFYDDDDLVWFFDRKENKFHLFDKIVFQPRYEISYQGAGSHQLYKQGVIYPSHTLESLAKTHLLNMGPFWLHAIENRGMIEIRTNPWGLRGSVLQEIDLIRLRREEEGVSFIYQFRSNHWLLKEDSSWKIADVSFPPPHFKGFKGVIVLEHTKQNDKWLLILPEFTFKNPSISVEDLCYQTEITEEKQRRVSRSPIGFAKIELSNEELIPVAPRDYPQLIYVLLYVGAYEEGLKHLKKYNMAAANGKKIPLLKPEQLEGDYPAHFVALSMHILLKEVIYELGIGKSVDITTLKAYYQNCYRPRRHQISGSMLLSGQEELVLQELCELREFDHVNVETCGQTTTVTIPTIELPRDKYALEDLFRSLEGRLPTDAEIIPNLMDRGISEHDGIILLQMLNEGKITEDNRQMILHMACMIREKNLAARLVAHLLILNQSVEDCKVNLQGGTLSFKEMQLFPHFKPAQENKQSLLDAASQIEKFHRLDARRILRREGPNLTLESIPWEERSDKLKEVYALISRLRAVCQNRAVAAAAPIGESILSVFDRASCLPILPRLKEPSLCAAEKMRDLLQKASPMSIDRFSYHKRGEVEAVLLLLRSELTLLKDKINQDKQDLLSFSSLISDTMGAEDVLKRASMLANPPSFFDLVQCFVSRDKGFYKAVIPGIDDTAIQTLFEATATLLAEIITQTKIEKILAARESYDESDLATVQAWSEVLSQDFSYNTEQIGILAFEALMGLQLRKEPNQLQIINQINDEIIEIPLKEDEIKPLMHFMMAGGGKTTVIFNVVMATCEGYLPCAIVPSELAESTISIFNQCLQKVYGYDVVTFNYSLKDLFKTANLRHILRTLKNARRGQEDFYHKTVVVLTKQMCWLLDVAQDLFDIEQFGTIDDPKGKTVLLEILAEFKKMRPVIDETDLQLKAKEAFNTIFGKDAPIPGIVLKVLKELWTVLLKYDSHLSFLSNQQNLKSRADYDAILIDFARDLSHMECLGLEGRYKAGFVRFITGQIDPSIERAIQESTEDASADFLFIRHLHILAKGHCLDREKADAIAMLKDYVTNLLPSCLLDRMGKAQYGIASREKKISPVVPFKAPGVPSRNDYAGEREAMTMTILYFLQFGIDMHSFRSYVTELREEAKRLEMEGWAYQETIPAQEYARLIQGFGRLEDSSNESDLQAHLACLNTSKESIICVATWLASQDIRFYPTRVGSDAYTFIMMFKGATGFSATVLSNFYALHPDLVKRGAPHEALQAKGDFLRRWIDDSQEGDLFLYDPHSFSIGSLIATYKENKTAARLPAAIADPCGEFAKKYPSRVALMQEIMQCYQGSDYKAFIYHDEVTGLPILIRPKWRGLQPQIGELPDIEELSRNLSKSVYDRHDLKVADICIYFDPGHCTGADYVFANDATMLMVMNKMPWSLVLQTQMRMRKRMFSQHVCVAVNLTFAQTLVPAGFTIAKPQEAAAILAMSAEIKEASQLSQDAAFALKKMVNAQCARLCRDSQIRNNPTLLKALSELLIERQSVSYFDMHGSLSMESQTLDELSMYCDHKLNYIRTLMQNAGIPSDDRDAKYVIDLVVHYKEEILSYARDYLNEILPKTSTTTTVKGVSAASEGFGAEAVLEVQAEEEAEEEAEQQIEIETQISALHTEYQIPVRTLPTDFAIKPENIESCLASLKENITTDQSFIKAKDLLQKISPSQIVFYTEFGGYDRPYGDLFSDRCLYSVDAACYTSLGNKPAHIPIFSDLSPEQQHLLIVKAKTNECFVIALSPKELGSFKDYIKRNDSTDVWIIDLSANVLAGNHEQFKKIFDRYYNLMLDIMLWNATAGNMRFFTKYIEISNNWINRCKRESKDLLLTRFLKLSTQRNYPDAYQTLISTVLNDNKRIQMCERRSILVNTCLPACIRDAIAIEKIESEMMSSATTAPPAARTFSTCKSPSRETEDSKEDVDGPGSFACTSDEEKKDNEDPRLVSAPNVARPVKENKEPPATVAPPEGRTRSNYGSLTKKVEDRPAPNSVSASDVAGLVKQKKRKDLNLLAYAIQINPRGLTNMNTMQKAFYILPKMAVAYLLYRIVKEILGDPRVHKLVKSMIFKK